MEFDERKTSFISGEPQTVIVSLLKMGGVM